MASGCSEPGRDSAMADLTVSPDVPELVPARMVNEFSYCQRLFFLE